MNQLRIVSNGLTHSGRVRPKNEDRFLLQAESGIWIVADGMGGHSNGDYASELVTQPLLCRQPFASLQDSVTWVQESLRQRHEALIAYATERGIAICGCTVVVLVVHGRQACVLWAGDSRAYAYSLGGPLRVMTRDHTYLSDLLANGDIAEQQAKQHPYASMVTRAVGMRQAFVLEEYYCDLTVDTRFLLCSDGLYNELSATEIKLCLEENQGPGATCQLLVERALNKAARDNITTVVVDVMYDD